MADLHHQNLMAIGHNSKNQLNRSLTQVQQQVQQEPLQQYQQQRQGGNIELKDKQPDPLLGVGDHVTGGSGLVKSWV